MKQETVKTDVEVGGSAAGDLESTEATTGKPRDSRQKKDWKQQKKAWKQQKKGWKPWRDKHVESEIFFDHDPEHGLVVVKRYRSDQECVQ